MVKFCSDEQKFKTKGMGINAGVTRVFNIRKPLMLSDPAIINVERVEISKRVSTWIAKDPLSLWNAVTVNRSSRLCSVAFDQLKAVIKDRYPSQYNLYLDGIRKKVVNRKAKKLETLGYELKDKITTKRLFRSSQL